MTAPPASTSEALGMLTSAMSYLAATPATQMPAAEQARCLATLERLDAMETAARALILAAFTAGQGYRDDGDYSSRSWLMHRTRVTKATATGHTGWSRRGRLHPRVLAALAAGDLSESYARTICGWTGRLPEGCRDNADEILVGAAQMGMDLLDLAALAAEIQARARPEAPDQDGPRFEDRAVKLETTAAAPPPPPARTTPARTTATGITAARIRAARVSRCRVSSRCRRAEPRVARAAHHRQGRGVAVGSRRARLVLAPPRARCPARRAQPAAGRGLLR